MKKTYSMIASVLAVVTVVTGCGYTPTPANNDHDQSWVDDHEENTDDSYVDEENKDDWNDEFTDEDDDIWDEEKTQKEEDFSLDTWGFSNSNLDADVGVQGYYITIEDYNRLISNMSPTEQKYLLYSYESLATGEIIQKENYNVDNNSTRYEPWGGSCYGMSISTALVNRKILSAPDLNAQSKLEDSSLTKNELSAINFYFWQQKLAPCRSSLNTFMRCDSKKQVGYLALDANDASPFVINFFWQDSLEENSPVYGHAVVGYGLEWGEWSWSRGTYSHTYDAKVLVYDCNAPEDESGYYNFYLDTEEGCWCYPAYSVMSTSNYVTDAINDNGQLGCVIASDDYLNVVDYCSGALSNTYIDKLQEEAAATIQFAVGQNYSIQSSSGRADVCGLVISDSTYGKSIHTAATVCGKAKSIEAFIPQNESYYNVSSDDDLNFIIDVGNMLVSVQADSSGSFIFNEDGSMELKCNEKPTICNIEITADNKNSFGIDDCNTIELTGAESRNLKISQTTKGIVVDGDDLSDMKINGQMYGNETSINASTEGESIFLGLEKDKVVVKEDADGDSKYDKVVSETTIPKERVIIALKNKSALYTGKNQKVDKAKVTGADHKNIIYVYYKDKACKKEVSVHKNVGTYYVKAFKLNNCGTFFESNVAKLTIKKGKQHISQKTKIITFKELALKKKANMAQIKVSSAGKLSYKKVFGNSRITVSSSGKLTAKKGLPKGNYKVKVKVSATATNNYKKASKTLTIMVKVK